MEKIEDEGFTKRISRVKVDGAKERDRPKRTGTKVIKEFLAN